MWINMWITTTVEHMHQEMKRLGIVSLGLVAQIKVVNRAPLLSFLVMKPDLSRLYFPVVVVCIVPTNDNRNVASTCPCNVTVIIWNISVSHARRKVKHDDCTIGSNIVTVMHTTVA